MSNIPASSIICPPINEDQLPAYARNLNQDYRYSVAVKSALVLFLPPTSFRPEAMRVSERKSENGSWFEVESYLAASSKWIDQKHHSKKELAIQDAVGWYPDPQDTISQRTLLATQAFEAYDFGDITITDTNPWDTNDFNQFIKVAYAESLDASEDRSKISFNVCFDVFGQVHEAVALDVASGNEIGFPKRPEESIEATSFVNCLS